VKAAGYYSPPPLAIGGLDLTEGFGADSSYG
jgi:hypothetical protein